MGTLNIQGGATASGDTLNIGHKAALGTSNEGSSVYVEGKGSTLTATHINVGENGGIAYNAMLFIKNGGHVQVNSNDDASIVAGVTEGITGYIYITGPGSSLNTNGTILLGDKGLGSLDVSAGGQVSGDRLIIGNTEKSGGSAVITGQGSAWNGQHGVWVGGKGDASLILSDGGSINDSSLQISHEDGKKATVSIGGAQDTLAKAAGNLNVDTIVFNGHGGTGNSVLNFNTTDVVSVRAAITGKGQINQIAGTTVLTGDTSGFTGSLHVTGGTLQFGNGGASGVTTVAIDTGMMDDHKGTIAFNHSNDLILTQRIYGGGSLVQMGTGTTTLTYDNTYYGGTTISGGTLSVSSDTKLGSISGGITLDGGTLKVTGTQFTSTARTITLGDHGGGFDIADADNTFTVAQQFSGQGAVWKRGAGTLILTGDNSFSGGVTVVAGTLVVGSQNALGSGSLTVDDGAKVDFGKFAMTTGSLAGTGQITIGSNNFTVNQDSDTIFSGAIVGSGAFTKQGTGTLTISSISQYTGQTNVSSGTLKQGAEGAFNATSSSYEIATNAALDLGGYSTSLASLHNAGNLHFGGSGGAVLNVAGNYSGNNGTITINTVLAGDNSKTDMLKVGGDTSGATKLHVNNVAGSGAQTINGIKVVHVSGSSNGTFSLTSGYMTKDGQQAVVGGAYAYTLQQGGTNTPADGDWYLVSHVNSHDPAPKPQPRYSAGVPVYEGYVQNMMALNKLPTLQQRVSNRYWTGDNSNTSDKGASIKKYGVWGRVEGAHSRLEPNTSTSRMKQDINTFIMQAGIDGQFYEGENGKLIAGITGQYGHAKGDVSSFNGDGDISTDAWSLGATATWYGNNGFYVDGQGQVTWFDNDLMSWTANTGLAEGRKATGYALSIEAGQRIPLQDSWALTPQAELMYSAIDADTFKDTWGSQVDLHDGDNLVGRIGLAADRSFNWKGNDGRMVNTSIYGIANLYQEFLSGTTVNVSGVDFNTSNDRTWAGIGAGGSYAWADDKYAIYGEGSVNTSLNHFADSYAFKATIAFKAKW
ncbi:autotransporter outer membrane beta-barrel domain-containing protein [Brucella sp. 21LCYQ03]|nr:autotransporter outer membrane beta-barrel domain-containing protein [Brucella sp. 21LCYQ03]